MAGTIRTTPLIYQVLNDRDPEFAQLSDNQKQTIIDKLGANPHLIYQVLNDRDPEFAQLSDSIKQQVVNKLYNEYREFNGYFNPQREQEILQSHAGDVQKEALQTPFVNPVDFVSGGVSAIEKLGAKEIAKPLIGSLVSMYANIPTEMALDKVDETNLPEPVKTVTDMFLPIAMGIAGATAFNSLKTGLTNKITKAIDAGISKLTDPWGDLPEDVKNKLNKSFYGVLRPTSAQGSLKAKEASQFIKDLSKNDKLKDEDIIKAFENPDTRNLILQQLPEKDKQQMQNVIKTIDDLSDELASRGLITPSQREKWKDRYLLRLYANNKFSNISFSKGITEDKIAKNRKIESIMDLPKENREKLGYILDPVNTVKFNIAKNYHIIATDDFYRDLVENLSDELIPTKELLIENPFTDVKAIYEKSTETPNKINDTFDVIKNENINHDNILFNSNRRNHPNYINIAYNVLKDYDISLNQIKGLMRGRVPIISVNGKDYVFDMNNKIYPFIGQSIRKAKDENVIAVTKTIGDKYDVVNKINKLLKQHENEIKNADVFFDPYGGSLIYLNNLDVLKNTQKPIYINVSSKFEPAKYKFYKAIKDDKDGTFINHTKNVINNIVNIANKYDNLIKNSCTNVACKNKLKTEAQKAIAQYLKQNNPFFADVLSEYIHENYAAERIKNIMKSFDSFVKNLQRDNVILVDMNDKEFYDFVKQKSQNKKVVLFDDSDYANLYGENVTSRYGDSTNANELINRKKDVYDYLYNNGSIIITQNHVTPEYIKWLDQYNPWMYVYGHWAQWGKDSLYGYILPYRPEFIAVLGKGVKGNGRELIRRSRISEGLISGIEQRTTKELPQGENQEIYRNGGGGTRNSSIYQTETIRGKQPKIIINQVNLPKLVSPIYAKDKLIPYLEDLAARGYIDRNELNDFKKQVNEKIDFLNQYVANLQGSGNKDYLVLSGDGAKYGILTGLPVKKPVALQFISMYHMTNEPDTVIKKIDKAASALYSLFKVMKVPFNLRAYPRNFISNIFQYTLEGHNPTRYIAEIPKTIKGIINQDKYYQEALENGLIGENLAQRDIIDTLQKLKGRSTNKVFRKFMDYLSKSAKPYGWIDDFAKFNSYRTFRKMGYSKLDATIKAQQAHYDYGLVPYWVTKVRSPEFGTTGAAAKLVMSPFVSFQTKSLQQLWNAIRNRPVTTLLTLSTYVVLKNAIEAYFAKKYGDKYQVGEKLKPDYLANPFVVHAMTKDGHHVYWDLTQIMPIGWVAQTMSDLAHKDIPSALQDVGLGTSPLNVLAEAEVGKDIFTGRELYTPLDTPVDKLKKGTEYVIKTLFEPATLTQIENSMRSGHPVLPRWTLGVNVYKYSPIDLAIKKTYQLNVYKAEVRKELYSLKHQYELGKINMNEYRKKAIDVIRKYNEDVRSLLNE